ncbi:MAG: ORF6N domain-containing protein, partial [Candidatus Omnitrophica bacterium]|nr:ORF6N domain-containing protein [Candidatus Omnitrophota bacterium]
MKELIPQQLIEKRIFIIRGQKVMIDSHLAELYDVETFNLNKAVKRNIERFPEDFMFQLTKEEANPLIFQIGISKTKGRGGRRYLPYAFTEQGVAMLSSVLNSKRAIQVNVAIMRAFVKLREILSTHKELAYKLGQLERKIEKHDEEIKTIFEAI